MADTRAIANLTPEQWDEKFFTEYLTDNRYAGEMGTNENSIIQVKENLTKKKGDRINFALVNKLTQDAVTGRGTMEGNEEDMGERSWELAIDKRRNAVRVAEIDEQYNAFSLREAAKFVLKEWSLKDTERLITRALGNLNGIEMTAAAIGLAGNQTTLDAWLVDNADRVFFGNSAYAASSGDLSAGLATLTAATAAERLTAVNISAMKFMAMNQANPKVRPVRSESNGRHYFTLYAHPLGFRDLKADSTITAAQREVSLEMENNRLFKGGDLLWDGVIIKEAHDLYDYSTLTALGDSGTTTVVPCYLCGAQAVGVAYGRRWKSTTEEFDYKDKHGVEISAIYGVGKIVFGSGAGDRDDLKDHGLVTGFFASSTAS
jgi:N4-gp56 family major capsid protein